MRMTWQTCRWPVLLLILWMITLTGIHSIPLEDHEALVIETAREMGEQGDWVLPSFNYEPRLNKPPASYWATAMVSRLDPFSEEVQIRHGRLVSLLAGLVMVFATYRVGTTLFDPATGKLASLMLLGMQGYLHLSHNARPDFLYALFGVLQLFAWMVAWKAEDGTARQRRYAWLGWVMAGLATLTKGPQVPAVYLAGMLVFLLCGCDQRRTLKVLRPCVGIAIFLVLVLPWWFLLQQRLKNLRIDLSTTQLSGSLLYNLAGWKEILSCYYPLNLLYLTLPASLVIPFVIPRLWKDRRETAAPTRILIDASAVLLLVFTLGGHYREQYLLPLLPASAILLARAVHAARVPPLQGRWKRGAKVLLALLMVLCLGLILRGQGYASLLWLSLNLVPLWLLLRQERGESAWAGHLFSSQLLRISVILTIIVTGCIAYFPSEREQLHRDRQSFAESVGRTLQDGDRICQWRSDPGILPFYVKRRVTRFDEQAGLAAYLQENHGEHRTYAVVSKPELPGFLAGLEGDVVTTGDGRQQRENEWVLVRLTGLRRVRP